MKAGRYRAAGLLRQQYRVSLELMSTQASRGKSSKVDGDGRRRRRGSPGADPLDNTFRGVLVVHRTEPYRGRVRLPSLRTRDDDDDVGELARVQALAGDNKRCAVESLAHPAKLPHVVDLGVLAAAPAVTSSAYHHDRLILLKQPGSRTIFPLVCHQRLLRHATCHNLRMNADYAKCGRLPESEFVELAVEVFAMLADATRVRIIMALRDGGELSVNHLADIVDKSPAAVSQHLAKMRLARIVATRQDGTRIFYRLANEHAQQLVADAIFQAEHSLGGTPHHHRQADDSRTALNEP